MKSDISTRSAGWLKAVLRNILWPWQVAETPGERIGGLARQGLALVLSALMIMIPMGQGTAFAQAAPPPDSEQSNPADESQPAPQGQPLSAEQLDQLVAPIALYPDALVAQVLAAATYPTQVVEADRWRQAQGNAPAEQIAAGAESQNWDPSVKALTAFPTVLAQMDRNIQWTTDLGNAYYNQPQDVMDSVQAMREKAQTAGQLRSTPQQVVTNTDGAIAIAPANPAVVYVPVYNPWVVYGAPFPIYPGYYYAPPPGIFWGGLAIGFGIGIGVAFLAHWGWGWGHWGIGWHNRAVFYNHTTYVTRSTTVINHGVNRPGGPPRNFGARGAYARPGGEANARGVNRSVPRPPAGYRAGSAASRPSGNAARPSSTYARSSGASRPPASANRSAGNYGRPGGATNHTAASPSRTTGNYGRPSGSNSPRESVSRAPSGTSGGGHPSGGGPSGGSHSSGGSHPSGGGHSSGGGHASAGGGHGGGHRG